MNARQKEKVRQQLRKAVKNGLVTRPSVCENCGATNVKIQAHHDDYTKPLAVAWLCVVCHTRIDAPKRQVRHLENLISASEFRERLITVYKAFGSARGGAHVWFSAQVFVTPYTVTRWLKGQRQIRGPALALLENLEAQASASASNGAR